MRPRPGRGRVPGSSLRARAVRRPTAVEYPRDPPLRMLDLAVPRQRLRSLPQAGERRLAAAVGDGAHEDLALLVLLELEVHAGQPEHRALERRSLVASLVEARADALDVRDEIRADLVHDVVAEPFEQAHDRLRLAEQRALLLPHQPLHPVLAAPLAAECASEAAHR